MHMYLHFHIPQKQGCTRLRVDGAIVSDPSGLMEAWTLHFCHLAESQVEANPALDELMNNSDVGQNEEVFLDIPFTIEEVQHAVNKMKLKKSLDQR